MAKKDKKDKKDKQDSHGVPQDAIDAVRAAIERTFHVSSEGGHSTRERTREIVDEIASAAGRVRQTLEDMKVLDELKGLRRELETLARRVAAMEGRPSAGGPVAKPDPAAPAAAKPATARPAAAKKPAAKKPAAKKSSAARKPSAKKPAARKSSSAKPAAAKSSSAKPAAAKPAGGSDGSS
jgi:hypothetical protein